MIDLAKELRENSYPGRGIVIGRSEDGKKAVVGYFIMGRSENSRNRVFVEEPDGIRLFLRAGEQCKRSGDCDKRACFFHFHSYFSFARKAGVIDFYSTEKLPCRPSCPPASNALRNGRRTRPLRNKPALADRNASHV